MSYLIAIDGTDASGKATQTALLEKRLKEEGYDVITVSFPDYSSRACEPVKMYLEGKFGEKPSDTNAYAASSFFAVDRYASFKTGWEKNYKSENGVILLNRYTTSNAVHQLSKMLDRSDDEKRAFLDWLFDFEFGKLGLPSPDLTVYLEMPTDISLSLLDKRCDDTGAKKDIHEKDASHLYDSHTAALFACSYLGWHKILCGKDGKPYELSYIHEEIYKLFSENKPSRFKK